MVPYKAVMECLVVPYRQGKGVPCEVEWEYLTVPCRAEKETLVVLYKRAKESSVVPHATVRESLVVSRKTVVDFSCHMLVTGILQGLPCVVLS